jgi:hypothetical protein
MPLDLPAPKRLLAASASPIASVRANARMAVSSEKVFIVVSCGSVVVERQP